MLNNDPCSACKASSARQPCESCFIGIQKQIRKLQSDTKENFEKLDRMIKERS